MQESESTGVRNMDRMGDITHAQGGVLPSGDVQLLFCDEVRYVVVRLKPRQAGNLAWQLALHARDHLRNAQEDAKDAVDRRHYRRLASLLEKLAEEAGDSLDDYDAQEY
jgi:hypothetical protein